MGRKAPEGNKRGRPMPMIMEGDGGRWEEDGGEDFFFFSLFFFFLEMEGKAIEIISEIYGKGRPRRSCYMRSANSEGFKKIFIAMVIPCQICNKPMKTFIFHPLSCIASISMDNTPHYPRIFHPFSTFHWFVTTVTWYDRCKEYFLKG